jgi:hypothetical protein
MKRINKEILSTVIIVIGILSAVTIFLPSMAFPDSDTSFSGIEIVFGTEFANFGAWASGNIHFSFLGVLAYLLPIGALIAAILLKNGYLISVLVFGVSAVLLFLLPDFTKTTITLINSTSEIDVDWVISYGLVLARLLAVIGVIISALGAAKLSSSK